VKALLTDFITMDLETIQESNQLNPYLITAYNGLDYVTSYATTSDLSLPQQKVLFDNFLTSLLTFFTKKSSRMMV